MSRTGPLGALPRLSRAARRALAGCAVLAVLSGCALVVQAWALADVVTGGSALAVLAGAVVARALLVWATQTVAARAAAGAKEELRARLLDRALALGPEWTVPRTAELTVLATRGLDALDNYFTVYLPALVTTAVVPLGIGAVLLAVDWPSAVVVAVTLPLVPLFAALVGLRTQDRVREAAATEQRVAHHLRELVKARPVLTAFRRVDAQARTIAHLSETQRRSTMATLKVAFASALVLELVATLSVALVAVLIGLRLVSGDLSLAVGLFVLILAPECYLPLRQAGAAHHASEAGAEAVREVAELPEPRSFGTAAPIGDLRVTNLRIRRRDGFAPDGVSFTARPGTVVRLNTPSASGKSTTFAALLGFVTPTSGQIKVGDHDLSEVDIEAWRSRVAWVPQHPRFAAKTVAEELGTSRHVDQLNLTHLWHRPLAELSTGERQRVAVARALSRDADVLLLDEPTAHQDPANATRVNEAIAASPAAVIVASHRSADVTAEPVRPRTSNTTNPVVSQRLPLRHLLTPRLLGGAALGALALLSGVALTATSAWLIAKAATQPPILTLGVAVVGVRTFGLARAGLRYAERLVTHDAAFRTTARQRVRLWKTADYQRLTTDVETVRDLTPRVLLPPMVAVLVGMAAVTVQMAILPPAGLTLAIAIAAAGLGAPAVALAVDRHATRALAAGRRRVADKVLTLLDTAPDLIAYGKHHALRADIADEDATLARQSRHQAWSAGAATALITLALGMASVVSVGLAGGVNPLLVPVLALVPLALTETLTPLPTAAQHLTPLRTAHAAVNPAQTSNPSESPFRKAGDPPNFQPNGKHRQFHPEKHIAAESPASNPSESPFHAPGGPPVFQSTGEGRQFGDENGPAVESGSSSPSESPFRAPGEPPVFQPSDGHRQFCPEKHVVAEPSNSYPSESPFRAPGGPPVFQSTGEGRQFGAENVPADDPGSSSPSESPFRAPGEPPVFQPSDGHRQFRPEKHVVAEPSNSNPSESPFRKTGEPPVFQPTGEGRQFRVENGSAAASRSVSPSESPFHTPGGAPDFQSTGEGRQFGVEKGAVAAVSGVDPSESPIRAVGGSPECESNGEHRREWTVALRGVDVRWPGADSPTLRDVSFDVAPGTHLAVVGPSGAGKSTLLALMAGLLPAERGTVHLPMTAWVPQEPHLVATTLRENLRLADPHATDDRLREVLRQAELGDWVDRLDEDPTTASGGEAGRIALARALLADADVLLLDEPTAHLDPPTAKRVLANLRGRTVVHVTHRPEEAADADAVLELA